MTSVIRCLTLLAVLPLAACSSLDARQDPLNSDFLLTYPEPAATPLVRTGSIMDNGIGLYPSRRAYQAGKIRVGDIVMVLLDETAQASRTSGLTAERESSNSVLGSNQAEALFPGDAFFNGIPTDGATISSSGSGVAGQSASLSGSISAVVIDVMDNGNLVILGQKQLTMTEGDEVIQVKGVVRPEDIQPDNTVLSRRIANAQISYSGKGDLARAVNPGWGVKLLFGLWPF